MTGGLHSHVLFSAFDVCGHERELGPPGEVPHQLRNLHASTRSGLNHRHRHHQTDHHHNRQDSTIVPIGNIVAITMSAQTVSICKFVGTITLGIATVCVQQARHYGYVTDASLRE